MFAVIAQYAEASLVCRASSEGSWLFLPKLRAWKFQLWKHPVDWISRKNISVVVVSLNSKGQLWKWKYTICIILSSIESQMYCSLCAPNKMSACGLLIATFYLLLSWLSWFSIVKFIYNYTLYSCGYKFCPFLSKIPCIVWFLRTCRNGVTFFSELDCIKWMLYLLASTYCLNREHKRGDQLFSSHYANMA